MGNGSEERELEFAKPSRAWEGSGFYRKYTLRDFKQGSNMIPFDFFKSFFLSVWRMDERGLRGGIREIRKRQDGGLGRPIGEMERRILEVESQDWVTNR